MKVGGQHIRTNRAFRRKHKLPKSVSDVVVESGPAGTVTVTAKIGDEEFVSESDVRGAVKSEIKRISWIGRLWRRFMAWLNSNEKGE